MTYTETAIQAERIAFQEGEEKGDVLAWLTAPTTGTIEKEWDEDDS